MNQSISNKWFWSAVVLLALVVAFMIAANARSSSAGTPTAAVQDSAATQDQASTTEVNASTNTMSQKSPQQFAQDIKTMDSTANSLNFDSDFASGF